MDILKKSNLDGQAYTIGHLQQYPGNILSTQTAFNLSNESWILDSGATDHVSNSLSYYASYHPIKPIYIKLPNGFITQTNISGRVAFSEKFSLENVLYIPEFSYNIISVSKIINSLGCNVVFNSSCCLIQDQNSQRMIGPANLQGSLYVLQMERSLKTDNVDDLAIISSTNSDCNSFDLWHYRLGHPSNSVLQQIKERFPYVKYNSNGVCDICHLAKQCKLSFSTSNNKSVSCFDLLHMDIWGALAISSIHGHRYFLTIVDDFSRHTWIFLMKAKSETRSLIQNFISYVSTQYDKTVKTIRSDNGVEFNMPQFYNSNGIIHQTSCVETPQQNAIVERKHRHLLNVTRSLLFHAKLPSVYWSYAILYSVHLINRLPTEVLKGKTPFEILNKQPPAYLDLKVFGSLCFVSTLTQQRQKLDPRARKCVYLGIRCNIPLF